MYKDENSSIQYDFWIVTKVGELNESQTLKVNSSFQIFSNAKEALKSTGSSLDQNEDFDLVLCSAEISHEDLISLLSSAVSKKHFYLYDIEAKVKKVTTTTIFPYVRASKDFKDKFKNLKPSQMRALWQKLHYVVIEDSKIVEKFIEIPEA
jgi:hypothetical protein